MSEDNLTRRLTVILHADVAASTALVQLDETLVHRRRIKGVKALYLIPEQIWLITLTD